MKIEEEIKELEERLEKLKAKRDREIDYMNFLDMRANFESLATNGEFTLTMVVRDRLLDEKVMSFLKRNGVDAEYNPWSLLAFLLHKRDMLARLGLVDREPEE